MSTPQQIVNVMVPVSDLDAAIAFYVERVGFGKRADIPFEDGQGGEGRWVEVGPAEGPSIALTPSREGAWEAGRNTGITLVSADIDATHERLRDGGVDVDEEIMRIPGPPPDMFWFRDGDGNVLLVVQDERGR